MSEKRQVLKAAGIVGALTLFSRFTGLIRDAILAALFGASRTADTFNTAFELVNQVRRVLGEGALSSFIVPVLTERRQKSEAEGWLFFNRALNFLLLVALIITLVGMWFAREIFMAFGGIALLSLEKQGALPHSEAQHYLDLGANLTALMFPYVIGITSVALFMGACHTLRSFTAPSLGSVMLNLTMMIAGGLAISLKPTDSNAAWWLGWSVLAGGLLRLLLMVPTLRSHGFRWQLTLTLRDAQLKKLLGMIGLGLLGLFLSQINVAVSGYFAWGLGEGVKTNITYANRLIQLPMALTATAVATALLPQLTQYFLDNRVRDLREMMNFIKRLEIFFMAPSVLGLMLLGYPITQMVFQRGAFNEADSWGTYLALAAYAPGLIFMGWLRILQPLYYARKDMWTPLWASAASVLVNVALNYLFAYHTDMRQVGLGLSSSIASLVNYLMLALLMRDVLKSEPGESPRVLESLIKCFSAALLSCGAGLVIYWGWLGQFGDKGGNLSLLLMNLAILLPVVLLYFGLARVFRAPDFERALELGLKKMKRGKKSSFTKPKEPQL